MLSRIHLQLPGSASGTWIIAVTALALLLAPGAIGDTFTWEGDVSTDWHTAGNWDQNDVPGADDIATIPNAANPYVVQITSSDAECASLNLGATNLLYVIGQDLTLGAGSDSTTTSSIVGTVILQEGGLKGASITIEDEVTLVGGGFISALYADNDDYQPTLSGAGSGDTSCW